MGKLFRDNTREGIAGDCSGTLVAVGWIITAAHCLYQNDNTSARTAEPNYRGYVTQYENLFFVPGESPTGSGTSAWTDSGKPYGYYKVVESVVPTCWKAASDGGSDDGACDYGLAELAPDSTGVYPGQRVGAYRVLWGYSPATGSETYMMGYPQQGLYAGSQCSAGFCLPANGYGDRPYFCEDTFDGEYERSLTNAAGVNLAGTGYYHPVPGCPMTGGASGGPDFVDYNGTWYVNGVNNLGSQNPTTGFGTEMSFNWWGSAFGQFFCAVLARECT